MSAERWRAVLYDLGCGLDARPVVDFVRSTFGPALSCSVRRLASDSELGRLARKLLRLRIPDPGRIGTCADYGPRELAAMTRILRGEGSPEDRTSLPLSGTGLMALLAGELGSRVYRPRSAHIVLTSLLPLTWDSADCRYHARSLLCGFPSIVSTTGAVEGPAKPRGYYIARMTGLSDEDARRKYIGRFLEHDDPRMPQVVCGLAAQAVFYFLTGEPFCEREGCRLFNAHWQEQLVEAQVNRAAFCEQHSKRLRELSGRRNGRGARGSGRRP
ncbi:MAG: hypothetical protein QXH42_09015 [Thermoplasmata archaeon]